MHFEIGTYHFGELTRDPLTGHLLDAEQKLADLVEQAVLAEEVGLDVFALGEHHRPDFAVAAPSVVLAAIAGRTSRIRLSSAVTVLGSENPVRLHQQFATVDLLSGGRAEIMVGKGSYTESFTVVGLDPGDQRTLFADNLDTLLRIRRGDGGAVDHSAAQTVWPRSRQRPMPLWLAAAPKPESVRRYAHHGLPLAIPMLGGRWRDAVPAVELFRELLCEHGFEAASVPVSFNTAGFVAQSSAEAFDIAHPHYAAGRVQNAQRPGDAVALSRADLAGLADSGGPLLFGSPQQLIDKILDQQWELGHSRLLIQLGYGSVPHRQIMKAIELLGTQVAPAVRQALSGSEPARHDSAIPL